MLKRISLGWILGGSYHTIIYHSRPMSSTAANQEMDKEQTASNIHDLINKQFSEFYEEHQACKDEVSNYQAKLSEFHTVQSATEAKCLAHYKKQRDLKNLIKTSDIPEAEKRDKLEELRNLERDSKIWKSFFPAQAKGILNTFIGPADVRMLNPAWRQRYKYVCYFFIV